MTEKLSLAAEQVQISEEWSENICYWLKEVYHIYKDEAVETVALQNVTLKIFKGEFLVILGPSGSGKTTLMNILGGLLKPSAGRIYFKKDQENMVNLSSLTYEDLTLFRKDHVGYVFQEYNLFEYLNVEENIQVPLLIKKKFLDHLNEKVEEILTICNIEHRREYKIPQLSGGEKQRTQVAMAISSDPEILIADEPTGNLDSKNAATIFELLKKIAHTKNTAVIAVSHDPSIISYADRIFQIKDGIITEEEHHHA